MQKLFPKKILLLDSFNPSITVIKSKEKWKKHPAFELKLWQLFVPGEKTCSNPVLSQEHTAWAHLFQLNLFLTFSSFSSLTHKKTTWKKKVCNHFSSSFGERKKNSEKHGEKNIFCFLLLRIPLFWYSKLVQQNSIFERDCFPFQFTPKVQQPNFWTPKLKKVSLA